MNKSRLGEIWTERMATRILNAILRQVGGEIVLDAVDLQGEPGPFEVFKDEGTGEMVVSIPKREKERNVVNG